MKYKTKPIERADIRERVEKKLRARGAVIFHGLIFLLGTALFLLFLPTAWENRFVRYDSAFSDRLMLYSILTVSFALHFIRYHFKHGAGYERHEGETAARINRELRRSGLEDAEEREAIIEIEGDGKLKNRRLLWQHFSLFLGINTTVILLRWSDMIRFDWLSYDFLIETFYFVGAWASPWLHMPCAISSPTVPPARSARPRSMPKSRARWLRWARAGRQRNVSRCQRAKKLRATSTMPFSPKRSRAAIAEAAPK